MIISKFGRIFRHSALVLKRISALGCCLCNHSVRRSFAYIIAAPIYHEYGRYAKKRKKAGDWAIMVDKANLLGLDRASAFFMGIAVWNSTMAEGVK